ncbi:transposable element Tcb1 transposase [Trichonephila clavipes]|uniref:Transposable element Tcb1 transposase n=1 Tax=Trichonephila clavipes TaxID=2585209 RepID=A0A8X7BBU2_TRICX|nr:transposable element Tcb1 transposase [Trichonephila clavipes]
MTDHIYRDVILELHVRLTGAEFLFMDDNARPHHANIVDECLHLRRMPSISPVYRNFGVHCLMSGVIFPKIRFRSIPTSLWPPPAKKSAPCACSEPWVHFRENFSKQKRNALSFFATAMPMRKGGEYRLADTMLFSWAVVCGLL